MPHEQLVPAACLPQATLLPPPSLTARRYRWRFRFRSLSLRTPPIVGDAPGSPRVAALRPRYQGSLRCATAAGAAGNKKAARMGGEKKAFLWGGRQRLPLLNFPLFVFVPSSG